MLLPTLLAVDDEPLMLSALIRALSRAFTVTVAPDALHAERLLAVSSFDLIVSDLHMPQRDGLELLTRAREIQPRCKRVLLTAGGPDSNADLSVCDAVLEKPWENAQLRAVLLAIVSSGPAPGRVPHEIEAPD